MSLMWMSRVYEALGALHAKELTPAYKLRGGYDVAGSVSWYGSEKFFGRRFANGERFTESHLSAAAMNLPFGTLVRITTPATGKTDQLAPIGGLRPGGRFSISDQVNHGGRHAAGL